MTHDELMSMSEQEREDYLHREVETLVASADPKNVLKLRRTQARLDRIRRQYKDPLSRCNAVYTEMITGLHELNDALNPSHDPNPKH